MHTKKIITSSCILLAALLSGCATGGTALAPTTQRIQAPAVNAVAESELGETILKKGIVYTFDGLELKNEIVGGDGIIRERSRLAPQRLIATRADSEWTYYDGKTTYMGLPQPGGLMVSRANPQRIEIWGGSFNRGTTPSPAPIVDFIKVHVDGQPSFTQELLYNGRSGSTVRFTYRELSGDMMRPAFTQEASYDLSEGAIIGFKGARIEVIEATNTKLKYRVLATFPQR